MINIDARKRDFYDRQVVSRIVEKYGINEMEAIRSFVMSESYQMLIDSETEIYKMSPNIVFEMWESEQITGDPRNSQYVRG